MKFKKVKVKDEASILTKRTKGEKILYGIVFGVFTIYSIILLYPLLYLLINSFQDPYTYLMNRVDGGHSAFELPSEWKFGNYLDAFKLSFADSLGKPIYMSQMFFNSLWYCTFAVGGQVLMSCFTGYIMSKYEFKGRGVIYALAIFSMTIPVVGTTGALFKLANELNIYNSPLFLISVSLGGWGFNFMVMYGFFQNVSWSYAEAVFLDGGGHFSAFFKVMLPQAKMSIVTLVIVSFIQSWNNYLTPLLYLPDFPTIASGMYKLKLTATRDSNMPFYYAGLMVSAIPVVVLYGCFSDVIMKNFSVGGLKG